MLSREWAFSIGGDVADMQVRVFNPNDSLASVQVLPSGCPDPMNERAPRAVALPAWGSRYILLSANVEGKCGLIQLVSTLPVQASVQVDASIPAVAP
jgi:hypothetical protein